jgi:AcrR family transcriptional regulator
MNEMAPAARAAAARRTRTRGNDPERTKADILEVAAAEFSEKGLPGARID